MNKTTGNDILVHSLLGEEDRKTVSEQRRALAINPNQNTHLSADTELDRRYPFSICKGSFA